ncbi:MAG: hypothetical protein KF785_15550 [Gemmatimonadales bacterium]|nr:hypothetical protein [Gemmatimonadales bacterium]
MRSIALAILVLVGGSDLGLAQDDPLLTEAEASREVRVIRRLGPDARARIEALLQHARAAGLPTQPIVERIEAGQSRRTPASQLVATAEATVARLESASREFRDAGRLADQREIVLAALVLERGGSLDQLAYLLRSVSPARSLLVPLDVMARLAAQGTEPGRAVEQVGRQLATGADDQAIAMLLTSNISRH